jgi:hypothetical protein
MDAVCNAGAVPLTRRSLDFFARSRLCKPGELCNTSLARIVTTKNTRLVQQFGERAEKQASKTSVPSQVGS